MKFKANLHDPAILLNLCQALEKTAKAAVVCLTERKLQLILADPSEGMQVWSGLNANTVLKEMIIESLQQNQIYFELQLDHLLKALKSASGNSTEVVMKLTKKNGAPYLSFSIVVQASMVITQDVPITLLSSQQIAQLTEPHLPDPRVHILLPPLKVLRPIVDRLKNISDNITIWGNMAGRLSLRIDTATTTVDTDFRNLEHPAIEGRSPTRMDENVECAVKVEIKKFVRFLWSQAIQPQNAICCLVENRAIVLHALHDDAYITYYIPALID